MFDISSLQYNSAYPDFASIVITVVSSMVLGVMIAFTYDKTSHSVNRPNHFLQAMILVTIVAATVIQAIGDSVARGLGMIGALSIIRFRTTIKNPRNIVFIFASIAVGIATGVFGFLISIVGTVGFCATAFLLYYSSFSSKDDFKGELKIELDTSIQTLEAFEQLLNKQTQKHQLKKQQIGIEKGYEIVQVTYDFKLTNNQDYQTLKTSLIDQSGIKVLKISLDRSNSNNI